MEPAYEFIIAVRGLERLLLSLGGFFAILLGTALFKWGIIDKSTLFLDAGLWKAQMWNASPGVIFCVLGVIVLCYSLANPLSYETQTAGTPATGTPATGTPATGTPATGTPATGTPATGTPATGTPAAGGKAKGRSAEPGGLSRFRYFSPLPLAETLLAEVQKASKQMGAEQEATLKQVWFLAKNAEQLLPLPPEPATDGTVPKEDGRFAAFRKAMDELVKSADKYKSDPANTIAGMEKTLKDLQTELKALEPSAGVGGT